MKNSPFKEGYRFITDVILINLLWLLISGLGFFITFGAATTAMFSVTFKLLNTKKQVYVIKEFYESFRKNFIVSSIIWLLIIVLTIPLYLIYNYAQNTENVVILISVLFTALQLLLFSIYVFPIIAIFKTNSLGQLIKNTVFNYPCCLFKF